MADHAEIIIDWQELGPLDKIPTDHGIPITISGRDIAVFRRGREIYAVDQKCYHAGE